MSAIVGICGVNFCTFVSDGRLSKLNENFKFDGVQKDDFQKIKKVNDKIIYGAAGFLGRKDGILDPFKSLYTKKNLTMSAARDLVFKYMTENKSQSPLRTAMLGGKTENGKFCIYLFRMSAIDEEPTVELFQPEPPVKNFAAAFTVPMCCRVPANNLIGSKFDMSKVSTHSELLTKMDEFVSELSKIDQSIGGKHFRETVV